MTNWQTTSRLSLRGALDVRNRVQVNRSDAICVYDIAEKLGVEVRFIGGSSFEGMYSKSKQTVLVPSLRPPGRQAYACGHELGHWYFDHGSTIEDIKSFEPGNHLTPEDQLANAFASCLIAPPWAVKEVFSRRSWEISHCNPIQLYSVANQLGMGYQTLIRHLQFSLRMISIEHAEKLLSTSPKKIREQILGTPTEGHLIIADNNWKSVAIDLQVGDSAVIPEDAIIEGAATSEAGIITTGKLIQARCPGIARVYSAESGWASYIRVSRKDFEGRALYRHMEDPDVN